MTEYPALSPDDEYFNFKPKPISKMVYTPASKNTEKKKRVKAIQKP